MPPQTLKATYTSPQTSKTFSSSLPPLEGGQNVQDKAAYLSALRSSISEMQGEVNRFLTQKMDEEKAEETTTAKSDEKQKGQEEREEEMYGEEGDEDDA